jgi:hypothetical protein
MNLVFLLLSRILGPPIKVPKRLPDVVSACTRVGQKLLVNLNETRPLLFQVSIEQKQ